MTPAGRERCADVTDQRVEFADRRGSASALRGLAEASGHSLDYVCELAVKNELGVLFRGGRTFRHRYACAPPRSPRQALLELRRKRAEWQQASR